MTAKLAVSNKWILNKLKHAPEGAKKLRVLRKATSRAVGPPWSGRMKTSSVVWSAFFDELNKITAQQLMHKEAKAYFEKVAGVRKERILEAAQRTGDRLEFGYLKNRLGSKNLGQLAGKAPDSARAARFQHFGKRMKQLSSGYLRRAAKTRPVFNRVKLSTAPATQAPSLAGMMQSPFRPTQPVPPKPAGLPGMAGLKMKGPTIGKGPTLGKIGMAKLAWDNSFWKRGKKKESSLAVATAAGVGNRLIRAAEVHDVLGRARDTGT